MAKAQSNAAGHEAPGKQHLTNTTPKCSSIEASRKKRQSNQRKNAKGHSNQKYDSSDDAKVAILSKKEESVAE